VPETDPDAARMDEFYAEFARRVKARREAAGLSQSTLERAAKVHPCTVSATERGGCEDLSLPELARIAAALRVDVGDLLPASDEPPKDEPARGGQTQWQ